MYDNRLPSASITFKEVNGLPINLDVYVPQNVSQQKFIQFDIMFYIHGGAMVAMDRTDIPRWLPVKAEQNNAILISTDYRLAPQAKISDSFQDVLDAFRYTFNKLESALHAARRLDPSNHISKRCIVFGGSAGGWLCLLLGLIDHSSYLAKICLGAIYPMTNLSDEHYIEPLETPNIPQIDIDSIEQYIDSPMVAGAIPDLDYTTGSVTGRHRAAIYMAQQAKWRSWIIGDPCCASMLDLWDVRRRIDDTFPSTFLLHGNEDKVILPSNSKDVANSLTRLNVEHCLHLVPEQEHFFDMIADPNDDKNLAKLGILQMLDWLKERLHQ